MIIIILLAIIAGILYRLGGSCKKENWLDCLRNTKIRDLGIPLIQGGILIWLNLKSLKFSLFLSKIPLFLLTFGLTFASLTTYHKWLNKFFNKTKENAYWFNWFAHGFFIGLSFLPLVGIFGLEKILLRAVLLGLGMAVWSSLVKWDILEEWGRGFLIIFSLLCLYTK
ncbi:MAG: hypothetical protein QXS18_04950 [Thermoplasmata archaeon]